MLCSVNCEDQTMNQTVNAGISKEQGNRRYLTHFDDGNLHNIAEVF